MHFKILSANYFNLDQSKILSSGNGLRMSIVVLLSPIHLFFVKICRMVMGLMVGLRQVNISFSNVKIMLLGLNYLMQYHHLVILKSQ